MARSNQFLLFGDSLTICFTSASELQSVFPQKIKIVNRGFGGINTQNALKILPDLFPTTTQASVKFLTIWFGANDANKEPSSGQHAPIEQFRSNLVKMITHPAVKAHSPNIILITPPPFEESMLEELMRSMGGRGETRKAKDGAEYAETIRQVGKEMGLPVLDVWTMFMENIGWDFGDGLLPGSKELGKNTDLERLLLDGLHLTPQGYRIVFDGLVELISEKLPEYVQLL